MSNKLVLMNTLAQQCSCLQVSAFRSSDDELSLAWQLPGYTSLFAQCASLFFVVIFFASGLSFPYDLMVRWLQGARSDYPWIAWFHTHPPVNVGYNKPFSTFCKAQQYSHVTVLSAGPLAQSSCLDREKTQISYRFTWRVKDVLSRTLVNRGDTRPEGSQMAYFHSIFI